MRAVTVLGRRSYGKRMTLRTILGTAHRSGQRAECNAPAVGLSVQRKP
jgi:hypothetical protein